MPSSVQHTDFDGDEEEHESDYNEMEAMANDAHDENGDTNDRNVESNDDDDDLSEEQQQHDDDIIGGIEDDGDDVPDGFEDDDDDIPDGFEGDDHIPNGIARMFAAQIERQLELFAEEQERAEYVQRLQQSNEPLPRPDQHSYLGDESHPLSYVPHDPLLRLPTNPTTPPGEKNNRRRRRRATSSSTVVNGHDDDDDGEDDDQNNKREVAVLEIPGVVLFPGCTIPIKLHDPTMISYIGRQLDVARSDPSKQPQVHVGVITRTGASVRSGSSEDDSSSLDSGGATESDHDDGEGDDDELQQEAGGSENPRNLLSASTGVMRRLIGGRTLRLHSQRRSWMRRGIRNANDRGSGDTNRAVRNAAFANERPKHHSFGRIGTIATITQTHERTSGTIDRSTEQYGDSSVWNRYSNAREIVFTAVGISRFRIIDIVGDSRSRYDGRDGNIFLVEDLIDSPMERPQFFPRPITSLSDGRWRDSDSTISTRTRMLARSYSQVTSIPYFVFAKLSPWSLMEQIVSLLKSRQGRGNLPILDTNVASSSSESDHEDTCDRRTEEEFMDRKSTNCEDLMASCAFDDVFT